MRIPSAKRKRYLTGPDWVVSMLDYAMKRTTSCGNSSQIVFKLGGTLDAATLRDLLDRLHHALPVLGGRVSRDINLCPYWRIPRKGNKADLTIYDATADPMPILQASANLAFRDENSHVAYHYIPASDGGSWFAITFDHRLFDARGAAAFLSLINDFQQSGHAPEGLNLTHDALLDGWKKKFIAGRNINRKLIALSKPMPRCLPMPAAAAPGFRYRVLGFDAAQSAAILSRASEEAGYLFEMPYLLASVVPAVDRIFKDRGIESPNYLVPVTVDARSADDIKKELFFNYVTYLFFKIGPDEVSDRARLLGSLKKQMFDHVKDGTLRDIAVASDLIRIAPLGALRAALNLPFKGTLASFCFSYIGRSSYTGKNFMGHAIEDCFHMPRVPAPPGLGLFFTSFGDRLHLTLSWLDGLLTDDEAAEIESMVIAELVSK